MPLRALLLVYWLLTGCQSSPPKQVAAAPPVKLEPKRATLGEHQVEAPAAVWARYRCASARRLPVAALEEQQLWPQPVAAGSQLTHQFAYALCPAKPAGAVAGTLYRKIYFQGRLVHSGRQPFTLKPGRWEVNAIIKVPQESAAGTYTLRTEFIGRAARKRKIKLMESTDFEVIAARPGP